MSAKITGMVFDRYPVGGGEMLLALALADHAHDDGTHIFPSVAHLAAKTRQSERSVQYQLRSMEESGWLILVNSGKGGRRPGANDRGITRGYRINPEWIKGANSAPLDGEGDANKGAKLAPLRAVDNSAKGANSAPFEPGKGASHDIKGCNPQWERVQSEAGKGATAIAPEPSVNRQEPSVNDDDACAKPGAVDNLGSSSSSLSVDAMVGSLTRWETERDKAPRFSATQPQFAAWVELGISAERLRSAYDLAVAARTAAEDATAVNAGFLDAFVAKVVTPQRPRGAGGAASTVGTAWVETPEGVTTKATEIGQPQQQAGEDRHWFRRRVLKAVGDPALIAREVAAAERMNINEYERVHRYFYGCDPSGLAI